MYSIGRAAELKGLTVTGGYATYAYIPESELIKIPSTIHPQQAVALFLNFVTAY
ncbi:hypothetical protein [Neobacillus ginsengisoli]|uniref:NADPH:quinone reductase-like Zn-dependent oxidoreductase n=1 Tax=Neobacillus ginsengisoli TaxID=904295 RepID=A0ABT9XXR8_9BACI|nr:hypothetical protein [Neobacillus ginsengisoli]MDQ0200373.1 NADPH:quinone reductase-like Zn-dependent oxidoreductase [Neobacillus ginsengisoli]